MVEVDKVYNSDCVTGMRMIDEQFIDLTVTSPPYDNLRLYNGYEWDFEETARQLYRITKKGGVIVWIVNDATIKGSETGTSFKQALFFKKCGFYLHDTMIWRKPAAAGIGSMKRYEGVFEYMFVFSKGQPKTANIIKDKRNKTFGKLQNGSIRQKDGTIRKTSGYGKRKIAEFGRRHNVWDIGTCQSNTERTGHPAQFPEKLVRDHIISWSNEGDIVLDCFMGSGTTGKVAKELGRHYIGFELSKEYCEIATERIKAVNYSDAEKEMGVQLSFL